MTLCSINHNTIQYKLIIIWVCVIWKPANTSLNLPYMLRVHRRNGQIPTLNFYLPTRNVVCICRQASCLDRFGWGAPAAGLALLFLNKNTTVLDIVPGWHTQATRGNELHKYNKYGSYLVEYRYRSHTHHNCSEIPLKCTEYKYWWFEHNEDALCTRVHVCTAS